MTTSASTTKRKTVEEILAIKDTRTRDVFIPDWDTAVTVTGLTKRQQLDIRKAAMVDGEVDNDKVQAGVFQQGVVDPKFTEDQMALVFEKNAGPVDNIITAILELSGMKEGDLAKKEGEFRQG
jgi:hypothetical protein